jgi:hypothetical protein
VPPSYRCLDFRIPISPTRGFFAQVRLFNYALRRLGPPYERAKMTIVVGDCCDIQSVRAENSWSEAHNIVWERVPDEVCQEFGIWGTANWRLSLPADDSDVVILSDADTVLLRDIDAVIAELPSGVPAVRGHMAHAPPRTGGTRPEGRSPEFWPWLFDQFDIEWTCSTYPYSIDDAPEAQAPAYFNLGFVVTNASALHILNERITEVERRIKTLTESPHRCQIAVTVIAHLSGFDIQVLPAAYNAANDLRHLSHNGLQVADIRVLHYLRENELDRSRILLPENIDEFISRELRNPANVALQRLVRSYLEALK